MREDLSGTALSALAPDASVSPSEEAVPDVVGSKFNGPPGNDPPPSFTPPTGAMAIRGALVAAFGNENPTQVFSLVWPGTKFDYGQLHWDEGDLVSPNPVYPPITDIMTSLLLDQWYPPAPITQPDGSSTAQRYKQAIGALAPLVKPAVWDLQQKVREALQADIYYQPHAADGSVGDGIWMSMSDLFDLLYGEWITAKRQWGELQYAQLLQNGLVGADVTDESKMDEWNNYTSWYELVADGYIADINEKYNQLLVYFPLTAWNDAIALLDTTDAPYLEEAKQIMRQMEFPIPHEFGVNYFPTTGAPYDFGNYLIPTTSFVDLLSDPQFIGAGLANDVQAFKDQIASLQQSCLFLSANLQTEVAAANKAYQDAQTNHSAAVLKLQTDYVNSTVTAAKAFIAYETGGLSMGVPISGKAGETEEDLDPTNLANGFKAALTDSQAGDLLTKLCEATAQQYATVGAIEDDLAVSYWTLPFTDFDSATGSIKFTVTAATVTDAVKLEATSRAGLACSALTIDPQTKQDVHFAVAGTTEPTLQSETVDPNAFTGKAQTVWLAVQASVTAPTAADAIVFPKGSLGTDFKAFARSLDTQGKVSYAAADPKNTTTQGQLNQLVDEVAVEMNAINGDSQSVITSGMALAKAAAGVAQAEARQEIQQMVLSMVSQVEQSAASLQQKLTEFDASSAKAANLSGGGSPFPVPLTTPDPAKPGTSMPSDLWDAVQLKVSVSAMKAMTQEASAGSQYSWGLNLFLMSASGSGLSNSASYLSEAATANSEIEVGMLCTKVDIVRSWMRPEIFSDMKDLYRATTEPVTNNGSQGSGSGKGSPLTQSDLFVPEEGASLQPGVVPGNYADLVTFSLPSYPVSLLIAKDVTIKVTTNAGMTSVAREQQSQTQASQGGFLCFSADSSSHSASSKNSQSSFCEADTQIFRLPAPQIIGVWSQLTPPDTSSQLDSAAVDTIAKALQVIAGLQQAKATAKDVSSVPSKRT